MHRSMLGGAPGSWDPTLSSKCLFLPNVQREAELPGLLLAGGADGLHVC